MEYDFFAKERSFTDVTNEWFSYWITTIKPRTVQKNSLKSSDESLLSVSNDIDDASFGVLNFGFFLTEIITLFFVAMLKIHLCSRLRILATDSDF